MTGASSSLRSVVETVVKALLVASLAMVMLSPPAHAQDLTTESAAVVKAAFLDDLDLMRGKFLGLAEAFPQDNYTWRPMEGVR